MSSWLKRFVSPDHNLFFYVQVLMLLQLTYHILQSSEKMFKDTYVNMSQNQVIN